MFWKLIDPNVNSFFIKFISDQPLLSVSFLFWIFVLLGLLLSIALHEFAHAYSAHLLGDDTAKNQGRMTINPVSHFDLLGITLILFTFIGYGKPVPVNPNNFRNPARGMMLVSLAGPATNFVLAFFCGISYLALTPFIRVQGDFSSPTNILMGIISTFVFSLGTIGLYNLVLMIFNLLPVAPLDGRKIFGYIHYSINGFLTKYIDPYGIWIVLFSILPILNGYSIFNLIFLPFYIFYTFVFGVRIY